MIQNSDLEKLEAKLEALDAKSAKLIIEINNSRNTLRSDLTRSYPKLLGKPPLDNPPVSPIEKVQLFLRLFRCREDVFPKRW